MDIYRLIDVLRSGKDSSFQDEIRGKKDFSINEITRLRKKYPDLPAGDLISLHKLRLRAEKKFSNADKFIFTDKSLQQATPEPAAEYHALKLKDYPRKADLCCGAGMDLIAMCDGKNKVTAVDLDPEILEIAKYNAKVRNIKNITFKCQKAEEFADKVDAVFCDPDRRIGNKRKIRPEDLSPNLYDLLKISKYNKNIMIKLSPAMNYSVIKTDVGFGLEFVSSGGELKEILLTLGSLKDKARKKAVIISSEGNISYLRSNDPGFKSVSEPGKYLYEPDPAVIRAGLIEQDAFKYKLNFINENIALLTSDFYREDMTGTWYRTEEQFPYNLRNLKKKLKEEKIGDLTVKTRGFHMTVEDLRKKLKPEGKNKKTIFIVRTGKSFEVFVIRRIDKQKHLNCVFQPEINRNENLKNRRR
ncbi:MAG: hypothetical protein CSB55_05665 [Candidatus Cloacimonadota bacterium]|nr:MAG: hypothetical protein CSB55_05665 [Candidatus Cloacimonadota bacterium]